MAITLITGPGAEPITTAEAKTQCRVSDSSEDAYIDALITAARRFFERLTGWQCVNATWELTLDSFPDVIELPRYPLVSVTYIKYYDANNTQLTLSSALYDVDTASVPPRIRPVVGESWPTIYGRLNSVVVRFVAGHGTAGSNVPDEYKQAIKFLVAHWFEHREPVVDGAVIADVPQTLKMLLGNAKTGVLP